MLRWAETGLRQPLISWNPSSRASMLIRADSEMKDCFAAMLAVLFRLRGQLMPAPWTLYARFYKIPNSLRRLARPTGFERVTPSLEGLCSTLIFDVLHDHCRTTRLRASQLPCGPGSDIERIDEIVRRPRAHRPPIFRPSGRARMLAESEVLRRTTRESCSGDHVASQGGRCGDLPPDLIRHGHFTRLNLRYQCDTKTALSPSTAGHRGNLSLCFR